ncbi:MAG TPA: hypothetical protein PKK36_08670 [Kiritimatiellia bacterium]|nr:hypothetical protein [Kiritimatiellia bacterium]
MAEVNFNCPRCQQSIEAPEDMVGESIKCPACGQLMTIPKPPTETGSPQENTEAPKSRIERAKIKIKSLFKIRPLLWIIPALLLGVIVATVAVILLMNPLYRMPEYWELRKQVGLEVSIADIRYNDYLTECKISYRDRSIHQSNIETTIRGIDDFGILEGNICGYSFLIHTRGSRPKTVKSKKAEPRPKGGSIF